MPSWTRTHSLKLAYAMGFSLVALVVAIGVAAVPAARRPPAMIAFAALLIVPSRVQAWALRDHFLGRRAHMARRWQDAAEHYARALDTLRARPWTRHTLWCGWAFYTVRLDALIWNNLAALAVDRRRPDDVIPAAQRALEIDPLYPLPHVNIAAAFVLRGDREPALRHLERARALGYHGTTLDQLIARAGERWAIVQAGQDEQSGPGPEGGR